jgi:hypothetical protein
MDKLAASSEPIRDLAVRYIGPPSIGEVFWPNPPIVVPPRWPSQ